MHFIDVGTEGLSAAGYVHSESWKESHRGFCSDEFVARHTPETQADYLRREMAAGKRIYMLLDPHPVGIVSVWGGLIENLYVLPQEQNKGYGTAPLEYAMGRCNGTPTLWILNINQGAYRLYTRQGFHETGNQKQLSARLREIALALYGRKQEE